MPSCSCAVGGGLVAKVVERRVADDPVEPRPQLDLLLGAAQREQRLGEGVLGHILGAVRGDDRRRVAGQRLAVAAHDLLEGVLIAVAHERDQAAVGLSLQRRAEEEPGGDVVCGGWRHWADVADARY